MSKTEIAKRYILFVLGLFFAAIGVAYTKYGELGVSPISSVANVLSCKFSTFSLGTWLIIWNCILIVGQIGVGIPATTHIPKSVNQPNRNDSGTCSS